MVAVRALTVMSQPVASLMSSSSSLVGLAGSLAPLASLVVFMAPWPTIRQIARDRSVGSLPLLPYSSMVASASVWTAYGILKQEPKVWSANGLGLGLGIYYLLEFIRHAPVKAPTLPGTVRQHINAVAAIVLSTVMIAMSSIRDPARIIGFAGVILCVAMFGSPLAALSTVFKTRSAKSIPLPFTLASVLNCFLWSIVGLFDMHDVNISAPNLLGLTFGLIQVSLKLIYGNGPRDSRYAPGTVELPM